MIAGRHDDDALVRPVAPVGEAAPRELAWRLLPAEALVEAPMPERLAGARIDCGGDAVGRRDGEETSIRVERSRAIVLVLAKLARVPLPRDLKVGEVRRVDLREGRVARAPRVGAPEAPLAGRVAADERRAFRGAGEPRADEHARRDRRQNARGDADGAPIQ